MESLESRALAMVEKVMTRDEILPYLRVCAANVNLSYLNQLLVYSQKPDAKVVCGRSAWKHLGRDIKPDAVPIEMLFPQISLKQGEGGEDFAISSGYTVVKAYDYESTSGKEPGSGKRTGHFCDRITAVTGVTWELVDKTALEGSIKQGVYDRKREVFCLLESCTAEQRERIAIDLFIDYVTERMGIQDNVLKLAVSFVIHKYFGMKSNIVSALFGGKLGKLDLQEKQVFLKNVQRVTKYVIDGLDGRTLSFNETAFVNLLLVTDEPGEVDNFLMRVAERLEDEDFKEEIQDLRLRLGKAGEGYVARLFLRRKQKQLYTYPPEPIEMDNLNLLFEERRNFHVE